ncbi:MAG: glycosyltransferase family 39 protein [Alphaproteobacteria bacterium]|nr:glycosyltransferase family 39 protein [Alphaproteobacteria bacterium]
MIESGNYLDIKFQNDPRYKKPIGIYWLQAASVNLLSPDKLNEIWAYRIPSLLGATITVSMTAAIGSFLFGPMAGFLAALMMASCVILNVEARLAKTDAAMLACIMVAQYTLARAYFGKPGKINAAIFWIAQSAGFLIKGPIPLLISLSTILAMWIKDRDRGQNRQCLDWLKSLYPIYGIAAAALLTAPWFISINLATDGNFTEQSAGRDFLAKMWQSQNRGALPPLTHLLALPIVFFPASLMVLSALPDMWKNRGDSKVRFCLGWIIPLWIVLEISLTKLPHYVMPAYPALAILAAKFMLDGFPTLKRMWKIAINCIWLLIGSLLVAALIMLPYIFDQPTDWFIMIAGFIFISAQTTSRALLPHKKALSLTILTIGTLTLFATTFGELFPRTKDAWLIQKVVQKANEIKPCDKLQIVSYHFNEPSLIFLAGTDTIARNKARHTMEDLSKNRCLVAAVNNDRLDEFLAKASEYYPQPTAVAHLNGYNFGKGKHNEITLYVGPQYE